MEEGGPGYGEPRPGPGGCRPGYVRGQYKLPAFTQAYARRHRHGRPTGIVCPYIPAKPQAVGCAVQRLVFNLAAGSSTLTEVSGPVLSPAQDFSSGGGGLMGCPA